MPWNYRDRGAGPLPPQANYDESRLAEKDSPGQPNEPIKMGSKRPNPADQEKVLPEYKSVEIGTVGLYAGVSTHDQQTLPMPLSPSNSLSNEMPQPRLC